MAALTTKFFFNDLIRKYVLAFGGLFSHIQVVRFNTDGTENNRIVVPIEYGPKEKWAVKTEQDPDLIRTRAILLPRMAYEITNIAYNPSRKQPATTYTSRTPFSANATVYNNKSFTYAPVPYDFTFSLYTVTKSVDDMYQVIEQILPFFSPVFTVRANVLPEIEQQTNLIVRAEGINLFDNWEGAFTERREIISTLTFVMEAFLYGPTRNGKIITSSTINFRDNVTRALLTSTTATPAADQIQINSDEVAPVNIDILTNYYDSVRDNIQSVTNNE